MPRNALLLHGTNGSPDSNWLLWLKNHLAWRGYSVAAPQLPNPEAPDVDRYWEALKEYPYDERTVVVGHSSGGVMALKILERLPPAQQLGHIWTLGAFHHNEDAFGCAGLFKSEWDWAAIKARKTPIEIWWAPDDIYIKKDQIDLLCAGLGVEPRVFDEGYGHFNTEVSPRFRQFPELAQAIVSAGAGNL